MGFEYRADELWCDDVPLEVLAERYGTPAYVYSERALLTRFLRLDAALAHLPHRICYAVKTNSNLAILGALARAGASFDIVSGGELHRLQRLAVDPARIVFAGVGKTAGEMRAALRAGVGMFNVESRAEARLLAQVAAAEGVCARVALRVNPEVDAGAHRYIATGTAAEKFGIPIAEALDACDEMAALPTLALRGLHAHVGSQILDVQVHAEVARRLGSLIEELRTRAHTIETLNVGGGLGIRYRDETEPSPEAFAAAVTDVARTLRVELIVEPGRSLVGPAGVLLCRVLYCKPTAGKVFVVVDAGMNDLLRPSLYGAYHEILPVRRHADRTPVQTDLVGPLCESGDFLARDRALATVNAGEVLAVLGAGAYGFAMSSNYNSRPRAAEILVRGPDAALVRQRESLDDLVHGERDWPPAVP